MAEPPGGAHRPQPVARARRGVVRSKFQGFLRRSEPPLRHILTREQINAMRGITEVMELAQRLVQSSKLPSVLNTAQDIHAAPDAHGGGHAGTESWSDQIATVEALGESVEHLPPDHGVTGLALKVGAMMLVPIVRAVRASGLHTVDDLATAAMLNPALARALLSKVPEKGAAGAASIIARQIRALAVRQAAQAQQPRTVDPSLRRSSVGIATPTDVARVPRL